MKHFFLILLLTITSIPSFGQSTYMITDSIAQIGIDLVDGGAKDNSMWCQVKKGDYIKRYSPWEVKEYGFKDGSVYFSKEIQQGNSTTRVFLQQLATGEAMLYYYKGQHGKTFFVEKDGVLLKIPKRDGKGDKYNHLLFELTNDCAIVADNAGIVQYNKNSFIGFFNQYNQCRPDYLPRRRIGISVGSEFSWLTLPKTIGMDIHSYDPSRDFSYTLGLSYIHPFRRKSFSFQGEILFLKHEYTYPETSWQESFSINTTTLRVPLLIRYSLPWIAQRPFFTVGAVLSRHLLLEKTSFPTTNTEISESIDLGAIQTKEAGFIAGAGVEFDVSLKQSVFIQCRYSYLHAIPIHNRGSNAVISMSAGINF